MKKFIYHSIFAAFLLFVSCDVERTEINNIITQSGDDVQFCILNTKATETSFEVGDEIGIFAVKTDSNGSSGSLNSNINYAHNKRYIFDGMTLVAASESDKIKFPESGELDFYCYYPYNVNTDPLAIEANAGKDLLITSNLERSRDIIQLGFKHVMSYINLQINNPMKKNLSAQYNSFRKATYNLAENNFYNISDRGYNEMIFDGYNFKCILPPQEFTTRYFLINKNGVNVTYRSAFSEKITLLSGEKKDYFYDVGHMVNFKTEHYWYPIINTGGYGKENIPDGKEFTFWISGDDAVTGNARATVDGKEIPNLGYNSFKIESVNSDKEVYIFGLTRKTNWTIKSDNYSVTWGTVTNLINTPIYIYSSKKMLDFQLYHRDGLNWNHLRTVPKFRLTKVTGEPLESDPGRVVVDWSKLEVGEAKNYFNIYHEWGDDQIVMEIYD